MSDTKNYFLQKFSHKRFNKYNKEDKIARDAERLFELEKYYYEPLEIKPAFNRNFPKYEFNGDRDKTSSNE